jgi:hypothetical protein
MKAISASIIVFAAALLIAAGAHIQHGDTRTFVMFFGCMVGGAGLLGWVFSLKEK